MPISSLKLLSGEPPGSSWPGSGRKLPISPLKLLSGKPPGSSWPGSGRKPQFFAVFKNCSLVIPLGAQGRQSGANFGIPKAPVLYFLCSFCLHGLGGFGLGCLGNGFFGWEGVGELFATHAYFKLNLQEQKNNTDRGGLAKHLQLT